MAAAALGWIGTGWGVVDVLSSLFHHDESSKISTNVRIGVGKIPPPGLNMGGSVPHVSLWDDNGVRIGQYRGNKNGHLDEGSETNIPIEHEWTQPAYTNAQATYLTLTMTENDAICVSYISLTWPSGVNYMFFGDVGYRCDVDWYHSDLIVDAGGYQPRCIWLDRDRSNGLHFQGMGLHITDFYATPERAQEYQDIPDAMCKSTPRFQMYSELGPDDWHSSTFPRSHTFPTTPTRTTTGSSSPRGHASAINLHLKSKTALSNYLALAPAPSLRAAYLKEPPTRILAI